MLAAKNKALDGKKKSPSHQFMFVAVSYGGVTALGSQPDDRITAMSHEISGRVVGPIRVEDFLNVYLPKVPKHCPKRTTEALQKHTTFSELRDDEQDDTGE
ncbi:hypothetical protein BU17DRAFT_103622 [Hysterangium stoloniferum]|nr:hypothetical protein BU17DRAFT_103622 [Hysterangium stoloniferum]